MAHKVGFWPATREVPLVPVSPAVPAAATPDAPRAPSLSRKMCSTLASASGDTESGLPRAVRNPPPPAAAAAGVGAETGGPSAAEKLASCPLPRQPFLAVSESCTDSAPRNVVAAGDQAALCTASGELSGRTDVSGAESPTGDGAAL